MYLSWIEPEAVAGVTLSGYHLDFSTDGSTWTRLEDDQARTTLPAATQSHPHTDDTLAAGTIRQYRIRAVGADANNAVFESGWVFASAATEEVGPPQNLAATADGRTRIDLGWDQPGFGADLVTGYRIDYTLASPESWQTLEHGYRISPKELRAHRPESGAGILLPGGGDLRRGHRPLRRPGLRHHGGGAHGPAGGAGEPALRPGGPQPRGAGNGTRPAPAARWNTTSGGPTSTTPRR